MAERRAWLLPAVLGVVAITALRVILLVFDKTDLFVDEAQYWLWGQELAFGYYSKPPMIGWVIRAFTELGSDAPFWIRLPGPLFHGATALILGHIAARLFDGRTAVTVALAFVTLPMVAVGSLLISTDTIMFPFLAAALAGYLRVLDRRQIPGALFTGIALGLAFLSKYAAIYYVICAILAAFVLPGARPGRRAAALIVAAFLITISPNIAWNLANGLTTVQHTLDNADWVRDPGTRAGLNLAGLAEFLAAQFVVAGPILFAALLLAALRRRTPLLILFALPILAIVCVQALLAQAYANWAAAAYLAGTVAAVAFLMNRHRGWLIASFAINGALCVLFPVAATAPGLLTRDGQPLLNRYLGRTQMSLLILQAAVDENLQTIVATDRDILADLFYTGRDSSVTVRALPPRARAPHHYAQRFPYQPTTAPILIVVRAGDEVPCDDARRLAEIAPDTGAYRNHPQTLYRAAGTCLSR
ncbi:MAG: glycosyltransferase family 39 protein [Rhodobacter sp.]|nr:glycosyltransferase family 39 protein [Rhodobacter sp.]